MDVLEDRETGEEILLDRETGEEVSCLLPPPSQQQARDAETGEPQLSKKRSFHIPKSALRPAPNTIVFNNRVLTAVHINKVSPHTNCLERRVECVSRNMSPIVFLLPTLFLFPGWATVLLVLFEIICHTWTHKKNKLCKDLNVVYRSPLNLITSEFCAYCQADKLMVKIGKLQDERMLQVHNRKLSYYVEKMSVVT